MTILLTDISQPLFFFLYERTNEAKGLLYQVQSNCSLQQNKKFTLISYSRNSYISLHVFVARIILDNIRF